MRTIVLKLHKPSKSKQHILDEALRNYNNAYRYLLDKAQSELGTICERYGEDRGGYKANIVSKWVDKGLSKELNQFHVQPFKDALKLDFGMTMASYFTLKSHILKANDPGNELTLQKTEKKALKIALPETDRPIYFCRYDTKRSYSLLYNKDKDRFYVKVYLTDHKNARTVQRNTPVTGRLIYVHKDKESHIGRAKETFLILPLSFGAYQEAYLKEALMNPAMLRTAKLYKRGMDYYLAVSIGTEATTQLTAESYLGVARGLNKQLCYTIVDISGKLLASGTIAENSKASKELGVPLYEIHKAANTIAGYAYEFKSQVILQNLTQIGDHISWTDGDKKEYHPEYNCSSYNRLAHILEYKLPEKGLPSPIKVSSFDIFYRCQDCGHVSRNNRFSKDVFLCTKCGSSMKVDSLGSLNLARKLITYQKSKIKIKVIQTSEGTSFTNKLLGLNFVIPNKGNQFELLMGEIDRVVNELRNSIKEVNRSDAKKLESIIKKVDSAEKLIDIVDFVYD